MQKFGFKIETRTGTVVDNLTLLAEDQARAEARLRQMYHHCRVLECRLLDNLSRGEGTDLESAIGLIVGESDKKN